MAHVRTEMRYEKDGDLAYLSYINTETDETIATWTARASTKSVLVPTLPLQETPMVDIKTLSADTEIWIQKMQGFGIGMPDYDPSLRKPFTFKIVKKDNGNVKFLFQTNDVNDIEVTVFDAQYKVNQETLEIQPREEAFEIAWIDFLAFRRYLRSFEFYVLNTNTSFALALVKELNGNR